MRTHEKLQSLLKSHGYAKQVEFARRLGVTDDMMSRWLNGKSRPSDLEYVRLARELGVTVDYLLDPARIDPVEVLGEDDRMILRMVGMLGHREAMARLLRPLAGTAEGEGNVGMRPSQVEVEPSVVEGGESRVADRPGRSRPKKKA